MKKWIIALLTASILSAGIPALAAAHGGFEVESIQEKISRLTKQINEKRASSTPEELNHLGQELKEAQETLKNLISH